MAWASSRQKQSEFQARYYHLTPKLKHQGAIVAVAHALARAVYNVLTYGRPYQAPQPALGPQRTQRLIRHHNKRLKALQAWLPKAPTSTNCGKLLSKIQTLEA